MNVVIRGEVPGRCRAAFVEVQHLRGRAARCDPNRSCARVWAGLALVEEEFVAKQAGGFGRDGER